MSVELIPSPKYLKAGQLGLMGMPITQNGSTWQAAMGGLPKYKASLGYVVPGHSPKPKHDTYFFQMT